MFNSSDQNRTFRYWITAIDDARYGSQYGDTSLPITINVPSPSIQTINNQPAGSGPGAPAVSAPAAVAIQTSSIINNPKLRANSIAVKPSSNQMKIGTLVRVTGKAKSGVKLSFSVSGPCEITKKSGTQVTIRGTQIGNCQVYALANETSKFNAADRYLTIAVGLSIDTLRISSPSKVTIGKEFKVTAKTKSNKPITWAASGSCEIVSQVNSVATLRAIGPVGNCLVTAGTSEDGRWSQISKSTKISIK
jgi:hypothetical protein